ncbi:helix-turn-helix domain-containing protein (plasmid) [Rhizobium etli bv. mimosae str. Mim1]|nr:helix-turn-helix domain-containing protein [Rhizobium etli bv. mimosae str. Mim1]
MSTGILRPLQIASLRWLAQGRTLVEISKIEGRTVNEIERCLKDALVLLRVGSVEEAIRKIEHD